MVGGPEQSVFAAVGAYVSDVIGCSPDRIIAVDRFHDGNRHAVYKVSYLGAGDATEDVVVRVSLDGAPADCAQAEREANVLEKLEGFAAPRLYDFRRTSPWFAAPVMCMEFLPGFQQELGSATPDKLERLGSSWVPSTAGPPAIWLSRWGRQATSRRTRTVGCSRFFRGWHGFARRFQLSCGIA